MFPGSASSLDSFGEQMSEKAKETALQVIMGVALAALIFIGCEKPERFVKKSYDRGDPNAMPQPQSQNASTTKGGMTISVAGETITTDDVIGLSKLLRPIGVSEDDNSKNILAFLRSKAASRDYSYFREKSYENISFVVSKQIEQILLYHVARKNAPSNTDENLDKAVEKEIIRYSTQFSTDYEALKALKAEMNFDDWDSFREDMKKQLLIQSYLSTKIKNDEMVSRDDLLQRYSELKTLEDAYFDRGPMSQHPEMNSILTALKAKYKKADAATYFRLIEIRNAELDPNQIDASKGESSYQAAMRIAKELRVRIDDGDDFSQIAAGFHGPYKNDMDLYVEGPLMPPYDILETEALRAKVGEVIGPVDAGDRVFIIKIESRAAAGIVEFEKIQNLLELQIRLERQLAQYEKVYRKLAAAAAITDKEKFIAACIKTAFMRLKPE